MWSNTWPRPTREERTMAQIDDSVSGLVTDIFATRNIIEDMSSRNIYVIVFDSEVFNGTDTYYNYRYWIDGLDVTLPGLTPGSTIPGFCSSFVGDHSPLAIGGSPVELGIDDVASFLAQQFGQPPLEIRQYTLVAAQPARAELVTQG